MARPALEIADIFRDHGPAWRQANAGHVSLGQLKVMSAIESCRTVALGGHVMRCEDCSYTQIAYNSCRNRHCPKCQGSQALAWMKQRKSELLDVPLLPRRVHAAGADCRHRLPEQGRRLRSLVQGFLADNAPGGTAKSSSSHQTRRRGRIALTLGGEIELDVANGWSERDICVAERVGGLRAIQNAQFGTAAEGF